MKTLVLAVLVAVSFYSNKSHAQNQANDNASICVVKNFISKTNSGRQNMTTVVDNELGPLYTEQDLNFEDFKVTFFNGTRLLELTKAGKNVASVRVGAIKSGESVTLDAYDSQSGQPTVEVSCRIVF